MKNMKAYVLYLGDGYLNSNYMVREDTYATVENQTAAHRMCYTPYTAVLIDHPEAGWILYDTGACDDPKKEWTPGMLARVAYDKPDHSRMEYQLGLVGITPKDVKHVILSHMHMDHLGNMKLFAETADFYVAKEEMANACLMVLASSDPEQAANFWHLRDEIFMKVKSYTYLEQDEELFPGVEAITLPGHSPCLLGLVIHLENQPLILASDAINEIRNYNGMIPGAVFDTKNYFKSIKKVKDLEKKYNAKVLFGHDGNQLKNEVKTAPEYYT